MAVPFDGAITPDVVPFVALDTVPVDGDVSGRAGDKLAGDVPGTGGEVVGTVPGAVCVGTGVGPGAVDAGGGPGGEDGGMGGASVLVGCDGPAGLLGCGEDVGLVVVVGGENGGGMDVDVSVW